MRARLALAQALLPKPELLILDEPGDGLDPEGIHEMRHTIQRLNRELGLTILLSSHLLNEVQQLCTRIAVLRQGQKVFEGTLKEAVGPGNWLRIRVNDFAAATDALRQKRLIGETRDGCLVALCNGVEVPQVVSELVGAGVRVFEVTPEAQTLEAFYLSLSHPKHS